MVSKIKGVTILGIDGQIVNIEVDSRNGLPAETIIGLAGTIIKESKSRVKSAIKNAGYDLKLKHYTINLAPAELRKEGALLDLPIALAILHNTKQVQYDPAALYVGELSLNGQLNPIHGILAVCELAKRNGIRTIYLPKSNVKEAAVISGLTLVPVSHLNEFKVGGLSPAKASDTISIPYKTNWDTDFNEVNGQSKIKRALQIAIAGRHHCLLIGPPGSGKSMLMQRVPTILPALTEAEFITVQKIASVSGELMVSRSLNRPFRSPHHSITSVAMVGGGSRALPGEITMATHGVLFLDEMAEFSKQVLESLRQPIEQNQIVINRANYKLIYPANFQLLATMNPCPCGYYKFMEKCVCSMHQINQYWKNLSGPILDRIDIVMQVSNINHDDIFKSNKSNKSNSTDPSCYRTQADYTPTCQHVSRSTVTEQADRLSTSAEMRSIIDRTVAIQLKRQGCQNGQLDKQGITRYCQLPQSSIVTIKKLFQTGKLSGRSYDKLRRLVRTIADIEQADVIKANHVLEAIQYLKLKSVTDYKKP